MRDTHALVHFDGKAFNIQPAERKTPVLINGKKRKKAKLAHRDTLTLGEVDATFLLYDEPQDEEGDVTAEELEAYRKLYDFSKELARSNALPDLLDMLMDHVIALTNADKGFLILVEGGGLEIKVARNMKRETIFDAEGHVSDSIINKVLRERTPIIVSDALNDTQKEILAQRGVLSPEEIHRLASKTKDGMAQEGRKAACHSDVVDDDAAQHLQSERLDPVTLEPLEGASASP